MSRHRLLGRTVGRSESIRVNGIFTCRVDLTLLPSIICAQRRAVSLTHTTLTVAKRFVYSEALCRVFQDVFLNEKKKEFVTAQCCRLRSFQRFFFYQCIASGKTLHQRPSWKVLHWCTVPKHVFLSQSCDFDEEILSYYWWECLSTLLLESC